VPRATRKRTAHSPRDRNDAPRRRGSLHARALLRAHAQALPGADDGTQPAEPCNANGGPREALWHAIIRKNYGCTHFIVGRDHAGPGDTSDGQHFYEPYAAQALLKEYEQEIGVTMVPFNEMVYVQDKAQFVPVDEVEPGMQTLKISGTELRRRLREGLEVPEWFSYPEIIEELRKTHPPVTSRGSRCSSPACRVRASRRLPMRCSSSCSRAVGGA
jgi:hypothetical protein